MPQTKEFMRMGDFMTKRKSKGSKEYMGYEVFKSRILRLSEKERKIYFTLLSSILAKGFSIYKADAFWVLSSYHMSKEEISLILKKYISLGLLTRGGRYRNYYMLPFPVVDYRMLTELLSISKAKPEKEGKGTFSIYTNNKSVVEGV